MELAPEPMNGTDAALWEIERDPSLRTTVVSILTLDRKISVKRLVASLEAASRQVPRLRQRVVEPPLGIGVPHWVIDDDFDVDDHVTVIEQDAADAGDAAAVLGVAAATAMAPFDRDRPLWHCSYLRGLDPAAGFGRSAVVIKVHHSLADGVGGVALLDALLDTTRRAPVRDLSSLPVPVAAPHTELPRPAGIPNVRAVAGVPARAARVAVETALHPLRTAASTVKAGSSAYRLLAPSGDVLSPLMTGRGSDRSFGVHEIALTRLHDAAARHRCSINHLFISGVLGGAAAYHRTFGTSPDELRVTMPVNFRRSGDAAGGNQWAPVRFRVPTDIDDPVARMREIRSITTRSRDEPALGFTHTLAGAVQMLPGALSSGIVAAMMRGVDAIVTNVPGLGEPRYLGGARVERMFAFAPLAGAAFNVALLSHGDIACIGCAVDTAAVADAPLLHRLIAAGLDEALEAAESAPPSDEPVDECPAPPGASATAATPAAAPVRLSALDESFLQLERESTPMHLGGLFLLDGDPLRDAAGNLRIDEIRRHVDARLDRAPKYLRRLAEVPFGQGRPSWVDDPEFDISEHVRRITLDPPGTTAHLLELVADLNSECLERDRPLWELWVIDGLDNGRVALLEKVHHAMVDGVSAIELTTALLDPEPLTEAEHPRPRQVAEPPGAMQSLTDAWIDQLRDPLDLARRVGAVVSATPGAVVEQTRTLVRGARDLVGPAALAPRSPLNQPVGPLRSIATLRLTFAEIEAARTKHGGTMNDIALSALAGGLRAWLRHHGEALPDLHVLCPVSTRRGDSDAGNQVGAMLIPLPLGEPDPIRRLHIIRERTRRAKHRHDGDGVALALEAFDHLPHVYGAALRTAVAHQPFVNLVMTNVPGVPRPLWFLGAAILEMVPIVPLGPNTALGVALLSYDDAVQMALHADPERCADLDDLAAEIRREFDLLIGADR